MNNEIQQFDFKGAALRTLTDENGEPWFVAKDVCDILEISNPSDALKRLDDDERSRFNLGRQGETNIVNEAGLYSLVLGSSKPEAHEFKRWVTHEVLPSIRKHGAYMTQQTLDKALTSPDFLIQLATKLKEEQEKVKELEPKSTVRGRRGRIRRHMPRRRTRENATPERIGHRPKTDCSHYSAKTDT